MRILAVILECAVAVAASAQSVARMPQLSLVPDLSIDVKQTGPGFQRDALVAVGPDGRVVLAPRFGWGDITAYDSAGRPLPWKLATGRGGDAEIMYPTRIGWISGTNTMWVGDAGYRQIVLVDGQGKITKSLENPSWVHPSWSDRRNYPVFGGMEPLALYADQSMLVLPARERSLIDTPGYDRSMLHVVRVSSTGAIQRTVALLPSDDGRVTLSARGCQHTMMVPFAARAFWGVSSDGQRVATVAPGVSVADSGTMRVTTVDDRGDTVFSRRYAQPAIRVAGPGVDIFLARIQPCGGASAEQLRDSAVKKIPVFRSFVSGILVGVDHSTWVTMHAASDTSKDRMLLVLDPRGDVVGTAVLPADQTVVAAQRDRVWTMQSPRSRLPATLTRYKVVPTAR